MAALNLRQIEVFRAVMTTGSIAGAAQMLFVSQPAVSRLLAHTEQRVGFSLFERIKGRLFATPEAKKLFHEVETVYRAVQRVNELSHDLARNRSGILNIVSSPSVGQSFIPQAMARFRQQFPDTKLTFVCHSYEHLKERLLNHKADLGIIIMPMEHPQLEVTPLCENRLVCVLPYNHPLAGKALLTLDDLAQWPMVGYGHDTPLGRMIAALYEAQDKPLSCVVEVGSPQNAGGLVEMGVGLALVDEFSVRSWSGTHSLVVRPLQDAPMLQASLVHLRYEPLSQLTQRFIGTLHGLVQEQRLASQHDADLDRARAQGLGRVAPPRSAPGSAVP